MHDVILRYAGKNAVFNVQFQPYSNKTTHRDISVDGKTDLRLGRDEDRGTKMDDVWEVPYLHSQSKERLGYRTQKPLMLLERIINASSNEGDVVFDPFCGCATTLEAAHRLNRRWIGIDVAIHAIKRVAALRLRDRLGLVEDKDFIIRGVPVTLEGALDLWSRDKHHFQEWAVETVDGFVTNKRTADGGVDGRLYFSVPHEKDFKCMLIEVKGGKNVSIRDLRALHGVLDNQPSALLAGLIIMEPLGTNKTRNFKMFMGKAGDVEIGGSQYARLQMLNVPEILEGKFFDTPVPVGRGLSQTSLRLKPRLKTKV